MTLISKSAIKRDYWPTQEWRTAEPESMGMLPDKLANMDQELKSRYGSINGIVIVRKGYIVFERYNKGYDPDDLHHVWSVTKSVISALTGIAMDAGYIKSADQKVLDFFPEYVPASGDIQKRAMTIKHLLTMSAPFAWRWGVWGSEPMSDRMRRQRNWVEFILKLPGPDGQLGKFQYNSAVSHLLSVIITRSTGISAREFANKHLFRPLGMREIPDNDRRLFGRDDLFRKNFTGWINDPDGNTFGGWGLTINPRDMARFGFLYLNRGIWADKQIISETWIKESTVSNANNRYKWPDLSYAAGYGYQWWIGGSGRTSIYFAMGGNGGNHIFCVPGKDLVVAIVSKHARRWRDRCLLLDNFIIPAVKD